MNDSTSTAVVDTGDQNLSAGIIAGLVAAFLGAAVWAIITVTTKFQIGWMAVGVGVLVGFAVRKFGNGSSRVFGVAGGALALLGCIAGNLLSTIGFVSQSESLPFFQVLSKLPLTAIPELLTETFDAMDLLFYGIAIYEGYKLALRPAEPTA